MSDSRFYTYNRIMKQPALYRMIIGQRSNGKTFGWCRMALEHYFRDGLHSAYIRRLDTMIERSTIAQLFDPHIEWIKKKSKGQWNAITYRSHCFYLARYEQTKSGDPIKVSEDLKPFSVLPKSGKCYCEWLDRRVAPKGWCRDFEEHTLVMIKRKNAEKR